MDTRLPRISLWLIALVILAGGPVKAEPPPLGVRVGVLFFEDVDDPLGRLRTTSAILGKADPPLKPTFAIGTYGELKQWLDNDLVDIAVVNPGLYGRLPKHQWEYLGSGKINSKKETRSVWLARKESKLGSLQAVQAEIDSLELLAVHPVSVSGFLNPMASLKQAGLSLPPSRVRFTHSHSNSLSALKAGQGPQIACVWEPAWLASPDPELEKIDLPLPERPNPSMAIVGRVGSPASAALRRLIQGGEFPGFEYSAGYEDSVKAIPEAEPEFSSSSLDRVGLGDLVLTLRHYNQTHPQPARLALVLTGGGAKCSYQAGAVRALEEELALARERYQDENLDLQLVVGTSGGAINALAVAMGLTASEEGYQDLKNAWIDLDQREIVSPPYLVRLNMWFWFASICGLGLLAWTRIRKSSRRSGLLLTAAVGLVLALVPRLPLAYSSWLGASSELQHIWTWVSFGIEGAGIVLLCAALGWEICARVARKRGTEFQPRVSLGRTLTFFVAVLPLVQFWTIFWHEEVISESNGLESALVRNFGTLITRESSRQAGQTGKLAEQDMQTLSREVFKRDLLRRDLVLTASPLTDTSLKLPGEFYFYAFAKEGLKPNFGERGVSLEKRPELLFDAMLGSAAIYPLFPAREIQDLPRPGATVDLVDGSFAHRSPLEAAVAWGATHVLVIEASTQDIAPRGKLLHNFGAALSFLYDQAQLVDVRLKGQTALYTLYPSSPHIGLLDFSAPLIESSLEKGYREAQGAPTTSRDRGGALHKELGPPVFWSP